MFFLEAARFLNAPVLAGHKVNDFYNPGLAARPPPTTAVYKQQSGWALKQPLCSHLHKITNEPVFYMALAPYDFDAGQRHYLGHWKVWAMKVKTFLGPETRAQRFKGQKTSEAIQGPKTGM